MMHEALIVIQITSILLMFVIAYYIVKYWSSSDHIYFFICAVAIIVNNVGYLLEMISSNGDLCFYGTIVTYLGKPFICASMFLFSLQLCQVKIKRILIVFVYVSAFAVFALVATSDFNSLFYIDRIFVSDSGFFPHNKYIHGPLWFAFIAQSVIYQLIVCSVAIGRIRYIKTTKEKKQLICIILISVISLVALFAFTLKLTNGYDTTSLAFLIDGIIFFICMIEFNMFESLEVVKQYMIDAIDEGIIAVMEDNKEIFYYNGIAKDLFNELEVSGIRTLDDLLIDPRKEKIIHSKKKIYEVSTMQIVIRKKHRGEVYFFKDVTDSYKTNMNLQSEVNKKERDLVRIQSSAILSMADMVEARDGYTGSHIKNTKDYVQIIVDALRKEGKYKDRIDEETASIIINAAPLHDIGKISVPDTILGKKGKLNAEEFEIMKKHTVNGANIITSSLKQVESDKYISISKNIALYHHERWDGTGYPEGLEAEEIPLSARIMAVADAYDALTSERSYKEAFSHEKAKEIMMEEKDSHFEGYILDIFFKNLKEASM